MNVPTFRQIASGASGFIVGAVIGFISGTAIGLWGARAGLMYSGMISSMGTNIILSTRAHTQYCNAECDGATAALLAWLRHLDAQELSDPSQDQDPLMSPRLVAADKTIVLGQLALLEERHGDASRANDYWRQAGRSAQIAQWKDYSEARIRTLSTTRRIATAENSNPFRSPEPRA